LLVLILACLPAWASSSTCSDSDAAVSSNLTSILKTTNITDPPPSSSEPQPSTSPSFPRPLKGVYIVSPHPFPEVEAFVATSARDYHLDLARYTLPMRPALEAYLGEKTAVKAIFVGLRRTDPHGKFLTHFDPTDKDWPQFMRVHPVIDWHYAEIWAVSLFCLRHSRFVFGLWRRDEEAG
jgi:FAD synthetase